MLFDPSTTPGACWSVLELRGGFSTISLFLSLGFFSLYIEFADFARSRRNVGSSLFASVAEPTWTCEGFKMPTTRSGTAGAAEAAAAEEVETSVTSGSSELHELQDQLATLTELVTQQAAAARQQMDAARRQEDRMKRLEDLLLRQTTDREIPGSLPPDSVPIVPERGTTVIAQSPVPDTPPVAPRAETRQETVVPPPVPVAAVGTVLPEMVGVEERERMMERLNEFRRCNPRVFDGEKADHWVVEKWLMHMEKLFYDTFVEERYRVWFKELLLTTYFPQSVKRQMERDLRNLRQGDRTVAELVQASNLSTYRDVVNRALIVEKGAEIMKERDVVDRSKGKRPAAESSGQQAFRRPPKYPRGQSGQSRGRGSSAPVEHPSVDDRRVVLSVVGLTYRHSVHSVGAAPSQGTPTTPYQPRRPPGQRQSESSQQGSSGRMYAAQTEGAAAAQEVVAGIIMLYDIRVRALFDTGASHSFIDRQFAELHSIQLSLRGRVRECFGELFAALDQWVAGWKLER
uniref:Retrotransposon gag domain-containing protein n=1 Tax=Ananas comosus var. bracteatus TaxID=296719 RepID=A0A6V7NEV3_ANACO|nr:unnamed protein product [Ananas comosus var. bracteatus]